MTGSGPSSELPPQPGGSELTYASYLHLDELLSLQDVRSDPPEHDELLFIVFHQVTELWFHQILHELDKLVVDFTGGRTFSAAHTLTRLRRILRTVVDQLDVLETLTPLSFGLFRDRLERASGFQSMQFREIEFVLGRKRAEVLDLYPADLPGLDRARRRLHEPSVVDAFHRYLAIHDVDVPDEVLERDVTAPTEPNEVVQDGILGRYLADRELRIVFELMTDVDEILQEWRYRHAKVVERTIGNKPGTAGSLGVAYLRSTIFEPMFPDLWAIRHRL